MVPLFEFFLYSSKTSILQAVFNVWACCQLFT